MSGCTACSHDHGAHEHFRAGSDCSLCDCAGYRRNALVLVKRLLHHSPESIAPAPKAGSHVTAA